MNWFANVGKYLWSRETTPYFTAPQDMTRSQARRETFAYAVFLGSVFGIAGLAAVLAASREPGPTELLWALGSAIVLWGCIDLARLRRRVAAWIVALAPAALLLQLAVSGFGPKAAGIDKLVITAFLLLLLRYGWRILRIHRLHGGAHTEDR